MMCTKLSTYNHQVCSSRSRNSKSSINGSSHLRWTTRLRIAEMLLRRRRRVINANFGGGKIWGRKVGEDEMGNNSVHATPSSRANQPWEGRGREGQTAF